MESENFSHRDPSVRAERFGKNAPDQSAVYVKPGLTTMSVGYMLQDQSLVSSIVPSVPVATSEGNYASYPKGHFFRDEMAVRADGAESSGGNGFSIDWSNTYKALVYAYHADAGPQARKNANGRGVDLDRAYTQLVTNKAKIKREKFFFDNFFKTSVWSTQVQGLTSGGGGVAGTTLSWMDANAKPLAAMKNAIRTAQEKTGYRMNAATFSAALWDVFSEHPNVINRINAGQTPGGPAEVSREMVARWLGLREVRVAEAVIAASPEGHANENVLTHMDTAEDAVLLTYTPDNPSLMTPSAFYFFDWQPDELVGGFGTAMSSWWIQERKSVRYEIEMGTDPKLVAADCGIWMYDFLAT